MVGATLEMRAECARALDERLVRGAYEPMVSGLGAEVKKKTDSKTRGVEVAKELRACRRMQFQRRLDLDDDALIDDHVEPLIADMMPFVEHGHCDFAADRMPTLDQLAFECGGIQVLAYPNLRCLYTSKNAPMIEYVRRSSMSSSRVMHENVSRSLTPAYRPVAPRAIRTRGFQHELRHGSHGCTRIEQEHPCNSV